MVRLVAKCAGFGTLAGLLAVAALVLLNLNVAGMAASMESAQGSIYFGSHFCF